MDHRQLEVGKVYNVEYVGSNAAYARINGKRTILIISLEPHLQFVELFEQAPNVLTDDLRSNVITSQNPEAHFKDTEISVPNDESEWFKHSVRVSSLTEAVEQGLITADDIRKRISRAPTSAYGLGSTSMSDRAGKHIGSYVSFNAEDKTRFPYLQSVIVLWNSHTQMETDFDRYR